MKSLTRHLTFNVPDRMEFLNITTEVEECVRGIRIQGGGSGGLECRCSQLTLPRLGELLARPTDGRGDLVVVLE